MANTVLRPALVAVATALLVVVTGYAVQAGSRPDDAYAADKPASADAPKPPAVNPSAGALFSGGTHFCSASVVHSAAGDVVLTAAHCLNGGALTFAPGYHDGIAPFGTWTVTGSFVADGWSASADPDLDFAFLTVRQAGTTATVESVTGANVLGTDTGFTHRITLTGYPDTTEVPVVCEGTTSRSDTYQQRVACAGFPDGTSGGPWVTDVDPATGYGTVIGVIGGYQLGGDTPDVSYSAYFDDDIQKLYDSVTG